MLHLSTLVPLFQPRIGKRVAGRPIAWRERELMNFHALLLWHELGTWLMSSWMKLYICESDRSSFTFSSNFGLVLEKPRRS